MIFTFTFLLFAFVKIVFCYLYVIVVHVRLFDRWRATVKALYNRLLTSWNIVTCICLQNFNKTCKTDTYLYIFTYTMKVLGVTLIVC